MFSRNTARPPQFLGNNCVVKNSLICEGAQIFGTVENSVISGGVIIEDGALIKDSVIMEDVLVEKNCEVYKAIIDSNSIINKFTIIGKKTCGKDNIPCRLYRGHEKI